MLKLNKKLKAKRLVGRKYRSPFYWGALFAGTAIFLAVWLIAEWSIPAREGKGVINTLLALLASAIPFMVAVAARHVVCVLGEREFSFFRAEVRKRKKNQKSESTACTNGRLLYADIRELEFLPAGFERAYGKFPFDLRMPHICLRGEGFAVTFPARRALVKKINEKRDEIVFVGGLPEEVASPEKPADLWGEILVAFEEGVFEKIWPSDLRLSYCTYDMDGDMIDITLEKGEACVCFNIEAESIYMCHSEADREETTPLAAFADRDALIAYMQDCAEAIR